MDEKAMQEIFHEFISSLEALDTHSSAISELLKDKGIATQEELAPYRERAGNASSVRWLGTRVRIDYLFSTAAKAEEDAKPQENAAPETVNRVEKSSKEDESQASKGGDNGDTAPDSSKRR
jgi:hypothetical protein